MNILEKGDATVVGVSSLYDTTLLEGKSNKVIYWNLFPI